MTHVPLSDNYLPHVEHWSILADESVLATLISVSCCRNIPLNGAPLTYSETTGHRALEGRFGRDISFYGQLCKILEHGHGSACENLWMSSCVPRKILGKQIDHRSAISDAPIVRGNMNVFEASINDLSTSASANERQYRLSLPLQEFGEHREGGNTQTTSYQQRGLEIVIDDKGLAKWTHHIYDVSDPFLSKHSRSRSNSTKYQLYVCRLCTVNAERTP
jgi:hypothetical protein